MLASPVERTDALARGAASVLIGQLLLVLGGLRHHLFWGGGSERVLLHAMNGFETACLCGAVLFGAHGWWTARQAVLEAPPQRRPWRWTLWILALAVLAPPFLTADPFDYVMRGRVLAIHGANPYVHVASEFTDDPFVAFGDRAWKSFPLPYGPIVANLQAAIAWLAHATGLPVRGELIVALLLFKLLFAGALATVAVWSAQLAERLRPGAGPAAFVTIAWNPLLLIECVASAHNEPLLMLGLVGAAAALFAGRGVLAGVALGCGVMTKLVPVVLVPLWAAAAVRRGALRALAFGLSGAALLAAAFWWQFGDLRSMVHVLQLQNDLRGASVWWAVHELTGWPMAELVAIGRAGIVAWLAVAMVRAYRRPGTAILLRDASLLLAALAVFGAPLFGPWYHAWWLPFALLLERGALFRLACATSVVAPLAWFVWTATRRHDAVSQTCIVAMAVVAPVPVAVLWSRTTVRMRS